LWKADARVFKRPRRAHVFYSCSPFARPVLDRAQSSSRVSSCTRHTLAVALRAGQTDTMALSRAALNSIRGLSCSTQLFSATCSCSYSSPPTGEQYAHYAHRSLSTRAQVRYIHVGRFMYSISMTKIWSQNAHLFSIKPHSLSHARLVNHTPDFVESSALLKSLLQLTGYYSKKSDLAEGTTALLATLLVAPGPHSHTDCRCCQPVRGHHRTSGERQNI
jgi:hypothetical protein